MPCGKGHRDWRQELALDRGLSEKDGTPAISSPTAPPAAFDQTEMSALAVNDDTRKPNEDQSATASKAPAEIPGEHLLSKVSALEKSWLSIDSDGKRVYSGLLAAADTKVFEGRETASPHGQRRWHQSRFQRQRNRPSRIARRSHDRAVYTPTDYEILQPTSARLELLPVSRISEYREPRLTRSCLSELFPDDASCAPA